MRWFTILAEQPDPFDPTRTIWLPSPPPNGGVYDEPGIDFGIRLAFKCGAKGLKVFELGEPASTVFTVAQWVELKAELDQEAE